MGTHMKRRSKRKSRKSRKRRGGADKLKMCMKKCRDDAAKVIQKAVRAKGMLSSNKPGSIQSRLAAYKKAAEGVKVAAHKGADQAKATIEEAKKDKMDGTIRGIQSRGGRRKRRTKHRRKSKKGGRKSRRKSRKKKRRSSKRRR